MLYFAFTLEKNVFCSKFPGHLQIYSQTIHSIPGNVGNGTQRTRFTRTKLSPVNNVGKNVRGTVHHLHGIRRATARERKQLRLRWHCRCCRTRRETWIVEVLEQLGEPALCRVVVLEAVGKRLVLQLVRQTLTKCFARPANHIRPTSQHV